MNNAEGQRHILGLIICNRKYKPTFLIFHVSIITPSVIYLQLSRVHILLDAGTFLSIETILYRCMNDDVSDCVN